MSTATSTIRGEEATVVQLPMNVKGKKIHTAKDGSVGSRHAASVWSRLALVATSVVICTISLGVDHARGIALP